MAHPVYDPFHLLPILPPPFGFDSRTVFPFVEAPGQVPPPPDGRRDVIQTPEVPAPRTRNASVISNGSQDSRSSVSDVSALLRTESQTTLRQRTKTPSQSTRRSRMHSSPGKKYDVHRALKDTVAYVTVLSSHPGDVQEPDDEATLFSAGDIYVHKDISDSSKPTYKAWVCAVLSDPTPRHMWCEVALGTDSEAVPHPNTLHPLFFVFHQGSAKASWVIQDTLKRYRQEAARKAMADKYLGAFPQVTGKRKGRKT